jgi:hypothetical protein
VSTQVISRTSFGYIDTHQNIDKALIPALIRNELHFFSAVKEYPAVGVVKLFGTVPFRPETSIGPAQMQIRNIERLIGSFPQLSDKNLGAIDGNAVQAATSKDKAPWFVAAYLAEKIRDLEKSGLPVTHAALIQKYNPGGKVHADHVHDQLIWIKTNHPEF